MKLYVWHKTLQGRGALYGSLWVPWIGGEKICVLWPAAGRKTQCFLLIFAEPGAHHKVHPCRSFLWHCARRNYWDRKTIQIQIRSATFDICDLCILVRWKTYSRTLSDRTKFMQRPARKKGSFAGILMGQHGEVSLSDLTLFPSSVQQLSSSFLVGTKVTSWSRNFEMVHSIKQIEQNI